MNSKKILLFARDPGGCNSISPLFNFLTNKEFSVLLYAKDFALSWMQTNFSLKPQDLAAEIQNFSSLEVESWIKNLNPTFVLTGTSFGDLSERLIWKACRKLEIPCFAILDHWINYSIRFKESDGNHVFPDLIIVPDLDGKNLALLQGLPESKIRVWGNPYYEYLTSNTSFHQSEKIRNKFLTKPGDILVSFASEPFSLSPENYGYHENKILAALIESLKRNLSGCLVVRPHPKENRKLLEELARSHSCENLRVVVSSDENSVDLIQASDLVCGMISHYLIEGSIFGKPVLSIQIGLNKPDPFILSQKGIVPLITTIAELNSFVQNFTRGQIEIRPLQVPLNSMNQILSELERAV